MYEDIITKLKIREDRLQGYLAKIDASNPEPEGHIKVKKRNENFYEFYSVVNGKERYLKKEDTLVFRLIQKQYFNRVRKIVETELAVVEKFLATFHPEKIPEAFYETEETYREYLSVFELPDQEFEKRWKEVKYQGNPKPLGDTFYITANGEKVRSKSEVIIADRLKSAGICYRYEYPFAISDNRVIYPDFTILNPHTREEIIWEHFGRMDDQSYRDNVFRKLDEYAGKGLFPGKGLIVTFEDYKNPLNIYSLVKTINSLKTYSPLLKKKD